MRANNSTLGREPCADNVKIKNQTFRMRARAYRRAYRRAYPRTELETVNDKMLKREGTERLAHGLPPLIVWNQKIGNKRFELLTFCSRNRRATTALIPDVCSIYTWSLCVCRAIPCQLSRSPLFESKKARQKVFLLFEKFEKLKAKSNGTSSLIDL